MIIQCKQCRTKFRFDDSLMQDDGVWMRCSICQHVFFLENPKTIRPAEPDIKETEAELAEKTIIMKPPAAAPPDDTRYSSGEEDVARFLDSVMEVKKAVAEDADFRPSDTVNLAEEAEDTDDKYSTDEEDIEEIPQAAKPAKKKTGRKWIIALWALLVILIIPFVLYFVIFPELGAKLIKSVSQQTGITARQPARPETVTSQVKLQDIRQRLLKNYVLGQLRVVEGTAVNQADYPISRIMVKGEILDAYAVSLGQRVCYAGNSLTDEELTTLTEDDIQKRLMQPEGRNNVNDKIMPNGQIPFMIVFTREPAGAIKTTVVIAGAEKLL